MNRMRISRTFRALAITLYWGLFLLCGPDVHWDVLPSLSTSRNTYCACVTTWTYVHLATKRTTPNRPISNRPLGRVVNVRPRRDACAVRAQRDGLTSARLSPRRVHTM